jgi:hypothetical protein
MGACTDHRTYKEVALKEALKLFAKDIKEALHDHGHRGYSGTIAENEAEEYINENADKWGPALIIKIPDGFVIGGVCSE